jgi:hypothetical protein
MIKVRSNNGTLTLTEQMAGEMDRGMTKRLVEPAHLIVFGGLPVGLHLRSVDTATTGIR